MAETQRLRILVRICRAGAPPPQFLPPKPPAAPLGFWARRRAARQARCVARWTALRDAQRQRVLAYAAKAVPDR